MSFKALAIVMSIANPNNFMPAISHDAFPTKEACEEIKLQADAELTDKFKEVPGGVAVSSQCLPTEEAEKLWRDLTGKADDSI